MAYTNLVHIVSLVTVRKLNNNQPNLTQIPYRVLIPKVQNTGTSGASSTAIRESQLNSLYQAQAEVLDKGGLVTVNGAELWLFGLNGKHETIAPLRVDNDFQGKCRS